MLRVRMSRRERTRLARLAASEERSESDFVRSLILSAYVTKFGQDEKKD
jgi:hypothetical protein